MSARPELAARLALHYLERASGDWQHRDAHGPQVHWPIAVDHAKRALRAVLTGSAEADRPGRPSFPGCERFENEMRSFGSAATPAAAALCPHCGGTGYGADEPDAPYEFCEATGRAAGGALSTVVDSDARPRVPASANSTSQHFAAREHAIRADQYAHQGMRWYNALTVAERRHWHTLARSARPADAYAAYLTEDQP